MIKADLTSDPLIEWNRLNKENHENLGASKMFVGMLTRFPAELGNYASWFTAGLGAVVALLLSNVDKVAPYLGEVAYARALTAFAVAVGLGASTKLLATVVGALMAMQEEVSREIQATLQAFNSEATKIRDVAKQSNVNLNANFNLAGLMAKFQSQFGLVGRFIIGRAFIRSLKSENPILHRFRMPIVLTQVEALCFVLSLMSAGLGVTSVAGTISGKAWITVQQPKVGIGAEPHVAPANSSKSKLMMPGADAK